MRILLLTAEPHPTFRVDVATLFGRILPEHGIHSDLVTLHEPSPSVPPAWQGGRCLTQPAPRRGALRHARKFLHSLRTLVQADRKSYSVIQVRDMPFIAAMAAIIARAKGMPFVYWMSYPIPLGQMQRARQMRRGYFHLRSHALWLRGYLGQQVLQRFVLPSARHVFAQSDAMKDALVKQLIRPANITPVPMGVSCDELAKHLVDTPEELDFRKPLTLAYLGTLDAPRKIEILFEALAKVRLTIGDARLVLIGDTKDQAHREFLKTRAQAAGVGQCVEWLGWLAQHQAFNALCNADIGLSPIPRSELLDVGSPTKVLEYIALGKPVVCNDNPDQKSVIDQCGGGLCVPYTPDDFADAVIRLGTESRDVRASRMEVARNYIRETRDYAVIGKRVAEAYFRFIVSDRSKTVFESQEV